MESLGETLILPPDLIVRGSRAKTQHGVQVKLRRSIELGYATSI